MPENKTLKVLVWGDSIAASGWPQKMEFIYNACINAGISIKVINKGVCGMPAAEARRNFEKDVLSENPDIVIIHFGANDQRFDGGRSAVLPISTIPEFKDHMRAMIKKCKEDAHASVLVFGYHQTRVPLLMPDGTLYNERIKLYSVAAGEVAAELSVPFSDMAGLIAANGFNVSEILCEDGVHPSALGVNVYADIAASELGRLIRHRA